MNKMIRPSAEQSVIAAGFALLNENPKASLADIANHAGVGRATLHRYFSGREDLIKAMAWTAIREMDEAVDAACADVTSYSDAIFRMLEALIPLGDQYHFLMREPVEDHADIAAEFARQQDEMIETIDAAKKEGLFNPSIPTDWIARAFENILYAAWESVTAQETTPKQATDLAWRTFVYGMGNSGK